MEPIVPAARTNGIKYAIRDLVVLAQKVQAPVSYFNIGDPTTSSDFRTPPHLFDAVAKAMRMGKNGYAPSLGVEEAREAIKKDAEAHGINNIQNVIVTYGASEGIEFALTALVNQGENVLTPVPGYPLYTAILAKLGCESNPYLLDEENGWQPDLDDIRRRIDDKTRAIVLINPNNPTGAVYSKETLQGIIEIAREHQLVILSDEIYDRLLYHGAQHIPTASLAEDVPIITFSGLSKNYLAPGWRVGWLIASGDEAVMTEYSGAISKLARSRLSASYPMQLAIKTALEGSQNHIADMIGKLEERASFVSRRCEEIDGMSLTKPKAAFYAFPRIDVPDDEAFVKDFLHSEHSLVVHGSGFGQKEGTSHIRIVYLPSMDQLVELFDRLERFMGNL